MSQQLINKSRILRLLLSPITLCLLIVFILPAAMPANYWLTRQFFYPDNHYRLTPTQLGIEYETITLQPSSNNTLKNWLLKPKDTPKATILFLHGNAQNISTHIHSVAWLVEHNYQVFMLDYRGYGKSTGSPIMPEVLEDVAAASQWLQQNTTPPYILMGQSLGAALAINHAAISNTPFNVIIIDAPFTGFRTIAQDVLNANWLTWALQYPLSRLIPDEYEPINQLTKITRSPILVFHSSEDEVIPYYHGKLLVESCPDNCRLITTKGPHIATFSYNQHRQMLLDFLNQNLQNK
ncbi:alpha/beta fold hydrolase [Endozoicomonas sp. SM1973]|uniref:Alpha/beta fold hydrolase n=1 Tax=Spartinivicinus marinus TaxID=2994442 RepID=A0A853ICX6_9GAMM|nr:alpha/beta fold hydrolase [Spartinivicinus marinus]MCX4025525.1 alpha/beta fold hydrolase [Spartinivicinus marinus]NYZ65246.1 alpha/beta fold hydrolase [Spartinivicinus marinus]